MKRILLACLLALLLSLTISGAALAYVPIDKLQRDIIPLEDPEKDYWKWPWNDIGDFPKLFANRY